MGRYPVLRRFAEPARRRPFLWSWKRPHTTRALYLGCILTCLPLYFVQIALAMLLAVVFRANLTVLAGLQMVSNPLTAPGMTFGAYQIGKSINGLLPITYGNWSGAVVNLAVGGVVMGLVAAVIVDLTLRYFRRRRRQTLLAPVAA